ncbi:hypothetical protein RND81_06G228800 [Saponaria officinalis]|uniref:Protein transport protein sec16 n=1 Tax=Saponaria officinalis TaxID=3572 RepID=A0AAW1KFQ8_SAPOF
MASNPPFELEDQTDDDFFDKLVDDDDDIVVGDENSLKRIDGIVKANDLVDEDEDESDEVKAFENLSKSEVDQGNVESETKEVGISDGNVSCLQSVEARGEHVYDGEVTSLTLPDLFSFENEKVVGDGVEGSEEVTGLREEESSSSVNGGVKEVQWSAFTDSADNDIGGFGSSDDFLTNFEQEAVGNLQNEAGDIFGKETITNAATENAYGYTGETGQISNGVDTNSVEYYENQYPGWKFDPYTGQWYQLDSTGGSATGQESLDASGGNKQTNFTSNGEGQLTVSDVNSSQVFYSQQNTYTNIGTVSQVGTTEKVSDWNHTSHSSHQNGGYQYPAHMVFDPQYPGWYYDTLAQEWRSLDTYHSSAQSTDSTRNQHSQNGLPATTYSHSGYDHGINGKGLQVSDSEGLNANQTYATSLGLDNNGSSDGQSEFGMNTGSAVSYSIGQSWPSYDSNVYSNTHMNQHKFPDPQETIPSYNKTNQSINNANWAGSTGNSFQPFNQSPQQNGSVQYSEELYSNQNAGMVSQPLFPNGHHVSYAPSETRSLTGRPPHALVTFGFGGKLLVMKETSSAGFSLHGSKEAEGHSLSVHNLIDVGVNTGSSGTAPCSSSYIQSLCHQSFPGPLVGGNAGSKDLNRWIDGKIANCETMSRSDGKSEASKLLFSLLKIACQHYGKLRSFGGDAGLKDNDLPELAVASLFASVKRKSDQFGQCSAVANCLVTLPSEAHIQATASEVQSLLISGRKREALQRAQEGQLWPFALILARELGDQFYADTVKQMAVSQLVAGSPMRTLCLLIAKRPEEVFSNNVMPAGNLPGAVAMSPQHAQSAGYSMVANWEENLAVITANRTENDNLVITHLGDSLWKEKNDVTSAHICYLIAEADFELYSESSRLCLIGADHWNFPRTYASPQAIQITELFEYAKVTGNSQFALLPLQPYKLIYAHMLAEIGKVSDSLKYCQAVSKVLKAGRSPEADILKQKLSSLEDRIRTHQQSGYAANLAPAKIVGKLLNLFDSTAHRVVGGLPPPAPSTALSNGPHYQSPGSKVRSSQSTMGMSSLMPSASMEPINQWAGDGGKNTLHNRSVSEPDFGRTPRPDQVDAPNEATSSSADGKNSSSSAGSTGTSRFSRFSFGASILQKTVGLVLKPRQGREAKLGDTNKFYYDEKLKRWVEEGAAPPAAEPALAPPPTTTAFQPEKSENHSMNAFNSALSSSGSSPEPASSTLTGSNLGSPAFPPSSNQFSARGRMGVRSRYVDTFNKGGHASPNVFQAPSIPSSKPSDVSSTKLFIPAAAPQNQPTFDAESSTENKISNTEVQKSAIPENDLFQTITPPPGGSLQRFPSVGDNISRRATLGGYGSAVPQSRRTASWSAISSDTYTSPPTSEVKASPLSRIPSNHSSGSLHNSGGSFGGDDLHEVEL